MILNVSCKKVLTLHPIKWFLGLLRQLLFNPFVRCPSMGRFRLGPRITTAAAISRTRIIRTHALFCYKVQKKLYLLYTLHLF